MKKKQRDFSMLYGTLAGLLLIGFPLCIAVFGIWSMNSPPSLGAYFPEGTQIIKQMDTHQVFFRKKGVAVSVVQIPLESRQEFKHLLLEKDFWDGAIGYDAELALQNIEEAAALLDAENVLWTYQDEAVAFLEEPFSDYFAAAYDVETGLCCWIEYDS